MSREKILYTRTHTRTLDTIHEQIETINMQGFAAQEDISASGENIAGRLFRIKTGLEVRYETVHRERIAERKGKVIPCRSTTYLTLKHESQRLCR